MSPLDTALDDVATERAVLDQATDTDPVRLFGQWITTAAEFEVNDPNAMAVSTTGADGLPSVRMVLLKDWDDDGFVFYTNTRSRKGRELAENMQAAAVLHWKSLRRQVRFRGPVECATEQEADAYFASRSRNSRIGAWASQQSQTLADRAELEDAVARETARFQDEDVQRPPHWSGYRIRPVYVEFWQDQPFRLHDRLVFERDKPDDAWRSRRLYP